MFLKMVLGVKLCSDSDLKCFSYVILCFSLFQHLIVEHKVHA